MTAFGWVGKKSWALGFGQTMPLLSSQSGGLAGEMVPMEAVFTQMGSIGLIVIAETPFHLYVRLERQTQDKLLAKRTKRAN